MKYDDVVKYVGSCVVIPHGMPKGFEQKLNALMLLPSPLRVKVGTPSLPAAWPLFVRMRKNPRARGTALRADAVAKVSRMDQSRIVRLDSVRTHHQVCRSTAQRRPPAKERRVVARLEASPRGFDARDVVTTLGHVPEPLYETVYCARGQAENLIKLHKTQLASDRTSCRSPRANQFRLILHTAADWLLHTLRAAMPATSAWAVAEFTTLRLRLIKIAARVIENAARIRIRLPSACPDKAIFRFVASGLAPAGP